LFNYLNKIIFSIILIFGSFQVGAEIHSPWEVAAIFLGATEKNPEFLKDIDNNILELARLNTGKIKLNILRDFKDRTVLFHHDLESSNLTAWDSLFFNVPQVNEQFFSVEVPGSYKIQIKKEETSVLQDNSLLKEFLNNSFKDPNAKRVLIIYGHGKSYKGLETLDLPTLRFTLEDVIPKREDDSPLDLLWFNSCFMASLEPVIELQYLSNYFMGSQEAEFTKGSPLETLQSIDPKKSFQENIKLLAEEYVKSYSGKVDGRTLDAAYKESATITVIDNKLLAGFLDKISNLTKSIRYYNEDERNSIKTIIPKIKMEDFDLVDLGSLLLKLRNNPLFSRIQNEVNDLINFLELDNNLKEKTQPKIVITPPEGKPALLLFGYDTWSKSDESDEYNLGKLRLPLKNINSFQKGWDQKKWPTILVDKPIEIAPFAIGHFSFHYYFVDPVTFERISEDKSIITLKDYFIFENSNPYNPILLHGHTRSSGGQSDIYTGLSIVDPITGSLGFDYGDLVFDYTTNWSAI
jgi:hypothetical protein